MESDNIINIFALDGDKEGPGKGFWPWKKSSWKESGN